MRQRFEVKTTEQKARLYEILVRARAASLGVNTMLDDLIEEFPEAVHCTDQSIADALGLWRETVTRWRLRRFGSRRACVEV